MKTDNDDTRGWVSKPPTVRKALGVDYGRRRIGLAVSTLGLAPRPLGTLPGGGYTEILRMATEVVDVALSERELEPKMVKMMSM